jgi:hypothetical protein
MLFAATSGGCGRNRRFKTQSHLFVGCRGSAQDTQINPHSKFGEPVAQIVPPPLADLPEHWLGSFAGTGTIVGDIVGPTTDESDWSVLKD